MFNAGLAGLVGAATVRRLAVAVLASVAGSERVAASDGAVRETVVPIACGASAEAVTASSPAGRETVVSTARGASWEAVAISQAGSNEVSGSGDTRAKSVASTACSLASSKATLLSKTIPVRGAGAKAISSTCHTGTTSSKAAAAATTTTCSAAASVELHADDVLRIGPALAQLLRAVLPGR